MKKIALPLALLAVIWVSCSKDKEEGQPTTSDPYMDLSSGVIRNYGFTNNNPPTAETAYDLTATNNDTVVAGKTYKVFVNSETLGHEYYNVTATGSGNNYYNLLSLNGLGMAVDPIVQLYLKDYVNVGTSWQAGVTSFNMDISGVTVPVTVTLTNNLVGKNLSRTVNGTDYTGVMHVSTSIAATYTLLGASTPVTGITSNIQSYYAPNVGLIENNTDISIDFMGIQDGVNTSTRLLSSIFP
jgi:hypothetical protein